MEIGCTHDKCTGCMACVNSCPRDAISVKTDAHGFLIPDINQERCVSCGRCQAVCPQLQAPDLHEPMQVYAMLAKEDALREKSSSGAAFSLLAADVLKNGGVVFGAAFDDEWKVVHRAAYNEQELEDLRKSKYVQSDIGMVFRSVKTILQSGKAVLFVGTPCQVSGLKNYLGTDHPQLFAVDLVCHGTPSPGVFKRWIDYESQHHGDIKSISFKEKTPGWKSSRARIWFENGEKVDCKQNEGYMAAFLRNMCLRESCFQCPYTCTARAGDITLGDYWGYRESFPECIEDDDRGISLVMLNTLKGFKIYKRIRRKAAVALRTTEDAVRGNPVLQAPVKRSPDYEGFWRDYAILPWNELMKRYTPSTPEVKDTILPADREYYAIPYEKRHGRHRIHCIKTAIVQKFNRWRKI